MPIDPSAVRWDDVPDPSAVKWDNADPRELRGLVPAGGKKMLLDELKTSIPAQALLGLLSGSSRIGNTLINAGTGAVNGALGRPPSADNAQRSAMLDLWREQNASAPVTKGFDIATQIAGTAGVGGLLGKGVAAAAPRTVPLIESLTTGGMRAGGAAGLGGMATRMLGGAAAGGASAALVNPQEAATGAAIGAALPPAVAGAGRFAGALRRGLRGGAVPNEVKALANRADALGIEIPADRIVNSKPMNAVASSLNYVPFSGRAAVESRMQDQLDTALSRTFGQNSPNVTAALRKANRDLGAVFDKTLKGNTVQVDSALIQDAVDVVNKAERELGKDAFKAIDNQFKELFDKGANGVIDGQAAYNIKKTLDRIGQRNAPEAFHARELKKVLMSALDRSLGPSQAAEFAKTRKQYGNMLDLENLAQNGAEGGVSIARLANMKGINNPDLQELADIAATFLKPRESNHSAMQRTMVGLAAAMSTDPVYAAGGAAVGKAANSLLDSRAVRAGLLGQPMPGLLGSIDDQQRLLLNAAPILGVQR